MGLRLSIDCQVQPGVVPRLFGVPVKASAKTLSSYFIVFAYIAYNLAQS
jgi:hypothetical protein